jgi:hypothetical protein
MWEEDWALLGIEPTTELGAIKKAYALKLKTTRPDDDAEAYQALRGAYERVQQWLKWQVSAAEEETGNLQHPESKPVEASDALPTAAAFVQSTPPVQTTEIVPPASDVTAEVLIGRLELAWRRGGEAALLEHWRAVEFVLDEQPLDRRVEFSVQFARWGLRLPQLPDSFLAGLNRHFGWLDDFRIERHLGGELAQALHDELRARLVRPVNDPQLLAIAEPLQRFNAQRRSGGALKTLGLALLLQPLLARLQRHLGADMMRRLGVSASDQAAVHEMTLRATWMRFLLFALGFAGVAALCGSRAGQIIERLFSWGVTCMLLLGASVLIGGLLNGGLALVTPKGRKSLPLQAWRRHRSQPLLGIGLMLLVAALVYLDPEATALLRLLDLPLRSGTGWMQQLALGLTATTGLLLAWPLDADHGFACVGLSPLVISLFAIWLLPAQPTALSLLLALAWMLTAAAVQQHRITARGMLRWPLRPMLNSLTLADRWGLSMAMLPAFCAFGYAMLPGMKPSGPGLFLTWVLANLVIGWLQARAEVWALARLTRASAPSAPDSAAA